MSQSKLGMIAAAIAATIFLTPIVFLLTYQSARENWGWGSVSREQFRADVIGKSREKIMDLYGRPQSVSELFGETWRYRRRTYSTVTGNIDSTASVWFGLQGDSCKSVSFSE